MTIDLGDFQRWACGNLVENRNRGIFGEYLVGRALDIAGAGNPRKEWDSCDLCYRGLTVEVKTSGRSQTWNPAGNSSPRFTIAMQKAAWHADTDEWTYYDQPRRTADLYVFCLHEPLWANNDNVADPSCWKFWVVPTRILNEKLGGQKTLGLSTLNQLADPVSWRGIKNAVDDEAGRKR